MVFAVIRVAGGEEPRLFENVLVDQKISRMDFVNLIKEITQVPKIYQQIKLCGRDLPDSLYPLETIKDFDEIEVCHSMMINWKTYKKMIDEIKNMTSSGVTSERREIALKAREQLSPLFSSKFFVTYPSLALEELHICKNINFYIHNTRKYLHRSVLAYFQAQHPDKKVELKDKSEKFAGIHFGMFVFIDEEPTYYAKTLGSVPGPYEDVDSDFPDCPKIDLLEIYVYFVLKWIGVGPVEIHVIPEINKSDLVFLATKLIDGFRTASGVSASDVLESNSSKVIRPVDIDMDMKNEMKILSHLLCLRDLQRNEGNHGVVEQEADTNVSSRVLKIVDFKVNLAMIDYEPIILSTYFEIGFLKTCITKWNLQNNIYRAKEEMDNIPALKNNPNTNLSTFKRYFERLEKIVKSLYE